MTTYPFDLSPVHPSWLDCIKHGLSAMDADYLTHLSHSHDWLPGPENIFNAFSLPLEKTHYVLLGESPYPRKASANGYAFWDAAVNELWSSTGMSKRVNRATSLRNILKMLLLAEGLLPQNQLAQTDIAKINKTQLITSNQELFAHLIDRGFLLLNTILVLQSGRKQDDARAWSPFIYAVLHYLSNKRPNVTLLLLGRFASDIAKQINHLPIKKLHAEHPYNLSFITNPDIINFFKPLHLLCK